MKQLIKMDMYELKHDMLSLIMMGVVIILGIISGPGYIDENRFNNPEGGYQVFLNMFYDLTAMFIIVGVFMAVILGKSFKNRTIINKAVISSRKDTLFSKAIINIIFPSVCILLYPICGCIAATIKYGWNMPYLFSFCQGLKILVCSFLVACAVFSIIFLISIMCRDNVKTLVCSVVILFGGALLFSSAKGLGMPMTFHPSYVLRCIVQKNMILDCLKYFIYSLVIVGCSLGCSYKIFKKCELK